MPIYNDSDVVITNGVESAVSRPDTIEIKNRTLDGLYHIQTIGTGGTLLDVTAHFTMAEKVLFDAIKRESESLKVEFDGFYYVGLIDGAPSYSRIRSAEAPMFTITFVLAVLEEGEVT